MFGREDQEPAFSTWYGVARLEETMAEALDTVPASEGLASPRGLKGELARSRACLHSGSYNMHASTQSGVETER